MPESLATHVRQGQGIRGLRPARRGHRRQLQARRRGHRVRGLQRLVGPEPVGAGEPSRPERPRHRSWWPSCGRSRFSWRARTTCGRPSCWWTARSRSATSAPGSGAGSSGCPRVQPAAATGPGGRADPGAAGRDHGAASGDTAPARALAHGPSAERGRRRAGLARAARPPRSGDSVAGREPGRRVRADLARPGQQRVTGPVSTRRSRARRPARSSTRSGGPGPGTSARRTADPAEPILPRADWPAR